MRPVFIAITAFTACNIVIMSFAAGAVRFVECRNILNSFQPYTAIDLDVCHPVSTPTKFSDTVNQYTQSKEIYLHVLSKYYSSVEVISSIDPFSIYNSLNLQCNLSDYEELENLTNSINTSISDTLSSLQKELNNHTNFLSIGDVYGILDESEISLFQFDFQLSDKNLSMTNAKNIGKHNQILARSQTTLPQRINHFEFTTVNKVDCDSEKCVALTFDDGPLPTTTSPLIDILRDNQVLATFYVVGDLVEQYPEILEQIHSNGHEIGNHTTTHLNLGFADKDKIREEVGQADEAITRITGKMPRTFRPTYGYIDQDVLDAVERPIINWSVDPQDWKIKNSQKISQRVIEQTKPGSIILLHDIHTTTVESVQEIITQLRAQGYIFVTVSDLLDVVPEAKHNGSVVLSQNKSI